MENHNINYYELFGVNHESTKNDILSAYKNKMNKFKNLNMFNNNQIIEIKLMKKGLYILLNKKLRYNYNKLLGSNIGPKPMNEDMDDSFDSVFNIDNSWMNQKNLKSDNYKKNDNNMIGDRIFSLSSLHKKPGYSTNDEIFLRKPSQGRIDKMTESN
jgi:curved DNA-binding protein CbpA